MTPQLGMAFVRWCQQQQEIDRDSLLNLSRSTLLHSTILFTNAYFSNVYKRLKQFCLAMFQNVKPKQHTNYRRIKNIRDLEPIYNVLRVPDRLPKGTYQMIRSQSHAPISTLKKWRKKSKKMSK